MMKKRNRPARAAPLILLGGGCLCLLAACGSPGSESGSPDAEIAAPENIRLDGFRLLWDESPGAEFYTVEINGVSYTSQDPSLDVSLLFTPGASYDLTVTAEANGDFASSDFSCSAPSSTPGLTYTPYENGYALTGCKNFSGEWVVIPDTYLGKPVLAVSQYAFGHGLIAAEWTPPEEYLPIEGVRFSVWLETIADSAFNSCPNLRYVSLPGSVSSVGTLAFEGCAIEELVLPESVQTVGVSAFYSCPIKKLVLPDTPLSVGTQAFSRTSIAEVSLPDDVRLGANVFANTPLYENAPEGAVVFGKVLYGWKGGMPAGTVIDDLPDDLRSVAEEAFSGFDTLAGIELPDSVTFIGKRAFANTGLESIDLPDSLTVIEGGAFGGCAALAEVSMPDVSYIGDGAFGGCTSLSEIRLPDSLSAAGNSLFSGCTALVSVQLPEGLQSIGDSAFQGCAALAGIDLPDGLRSIGNHAFEGCAALGSVQLPDSLQSVGEYTFADCSSLQSADFGSALSSIGNYAFRGTALTSLDLPRTVASVGIGAFRDCPALKEVTLSGNAEMGMSVFAGSALESVTFLPGTSAVGDNAFEGCAQLTEVVLPDGVSEIGHAAFRDCTSLREIDLPDSVVSVGRYAFRGTALQNFALPENVREIGIGAFQNCAELESVTLPASLQSVGRNAFSGCENLSAVYYAGDEAGWAEICENIALPEGAQIYFTGASDAAEESALPASLPAVAQKRKYMAC